MTRGTTGHPDIHGRDHRPPGWNDPSDPGGADPLSWLTPPASGAGIHYGDNVPVSGDDWLFIETTGTDGDGFGTRLYTTEGDASWQVDNGNLTLNATNATGAVVIEGGDYTEVAINSNLPTYDAARMFKVTLNGASMFEFWGDGTVHGRAAIGAITWDL